MTNPKYIAGNHVSLAAHSFPGGPFKVLQSIRSDREQPIEGLTFLATRRVGATLYSPAGSDQTNCRYAVPISLTELDTITAGGLR